MRSKLRDKKPPPATSRYELAGVAVLARQPYLDQLNASVSSIESSLASGDYSAAKVKLPPPRYQPVMRNANGQTVILQFTADGFIERPIRARTSLEIMATGGVSGGYLPMSRPPKFRPDGRPGDPAAWVGEYIHALPRRAKFDQQIANWSTATETFDESVSAKRRSDDEWRQAYFKSVRDSAGARFPITQSENSAPRGAGSQTKAKPWTEDEYHEAFFNAFRKNSEALLNESRDDQGPLPQDAFAAVLDPFNAMPAYAAKRNPSGSMGNQLVSLVQEQFSPQMRDGLNAFLQQRVEAMTKGGGALADIRNAFAAAKDFGDDGALDALASLADKVGIPRNAFNGKKGGFDIGDLIEKGIDKLGSEAIGKGLESVLGSEAANVLKAAGGVDLLGAASQNLLLGENNDLGALAENFMDKLPGAIVDQALDSLIGKVDDRSSMAKQLLNQYKGQIKGLLKQLISGDLASSLEKKFEETFEGAKSTASVPLGLAKPGGGPEVVLVNGLPITRLLDICDMAEVPDKGPFFQGNPTIRVNGMPPAGKVHAARGAKNTIATPLMLSPDVLIGTATVTVKISVEAEAPKASAGVASGKAPASSPQSGVSTEDAPASEAGRGEPSHAENQAPSDLSSGAACEKEPWREQLRQQLEDEEAQMCFRDPTAQVLADGELSKSEHEARNDFNYCPTGKLDGTVDGVNWDDKFFDGYHKPLDCTEGRPVDGSLGPGSYECCYDPKTGELVPNSPKSGTYNLDSSLGYCDDGEPEDFEIFDDKPGSGHGELDVCPHERWPNYDHENMSYRPPPVAPPEPPPLNPRTPGNVEIDPITGQTIYH